LLQPSSTCSSDTAVGIAIGAGLGGGLLVLIIIALVIVGIILFFKKRDKTVVFGFTKEMASVHSNSFSAW